LGYIAADKAKKVLVPFLTDLKQDLECLKFHIKDREKRNKLLEEEKKRLKNKEKQIDELLNQATRSLKSKNDEVAELSETTEQLIKSSFALSMKNIKMKVTNAKQEKEILALKKKLSGFQFK
jgi:chromosome segregation ATPase